MRTSMLCAVLVVALASAACHAVPAGTATPVGMTANEVSQAELKASGGSSVLEALTRARRNFFRSRGVSSLQNPPMDAWLVFRDGALMGTIDVFAMMRPDEVRYVRRLSAVETRHKYGRAVSQGAFEIELVRN